MLKYKYIAVLFFTIVSLTVGQTGLLKGTIKDAESGLPISNVSVMIMELQLLTTSDNSGNYSLNIIRDGKYTLTFSHIGYKVENKKIVVTSNNVMEVNISLRKSEIMLGEAVVTSTRSVRVVKDVPIPIDLIDSKTIEQSIKLTTSDVMEEAPGVTVVRDGAWATAVNIRGLSKQNVVYLIDGNRIETSTNIAGGLSLIDLSDVKSIEIVKGGLSSLYGTGATGGVVNIITNRGTTSERFYFNGSLSSSYASVNSGKTASVNLSASDKIWYTDFTATMRNADDTKIPGGMLHNSGFQDNSFSFSAGVLPVENVEVKFEYQKFSAEDVGIPGGSPFPDGATATYIYANRKMLSGEINIKQLSNTLSNIKLKYYDQLISREVELIPNSKVIIVPQADHKTNGLLFQADWTLAKNHFLITGIDAWQRSYVGERSKTIKPLNKVIVDKPVPNSKFASLGFFIHDEIHLIKDKFKLNLGARYDLIKITNEQTNNPIAIITNGNEITPPPNPAASYDAYNVNNKSWSGNVGLLYSLFNNINLTFNTAYTFRSPSLEERYQYIDLGSTVYYGNPNLMPEKGLSFDFGLRIWKNRFTVTADVFINSLNDLVIDKQISDSSYQKQNIGKAKLVGFDAKVEYNFFKNYVAYITVAYVNGKDTEKNVYLPQIPPFNGALGFKIPVNYFDIDLSATFYDSQNKVSPTETTTPGYAYFDLAVNSYPISISLLKLQIFAGVLNIFNASYRSHLSTYRGINLTEPGRNIYAKVKLSW